MENNLKRRAEVHRLSHRRTLMDHVVDLFERHAEDYAVEGKRLIRRLVRVVTIGGIALIVLSASLIALVVHALVH